MSFDWDSSCTIVSSEVDNKKTIIFEAFPPLAGTYPYDIVRGVHGLGAVGAEKRESGA